MNPDFDIILTASLVSAACSIPGVFLVLRKMSMMSDAIGHAILPGIVIGFFITQDLSSPWLIIGAGLTGLLTVFLVEVINRHQLIKEDAAMGMVFPLFFSIGVILVTLFARNVHIDTDAVLLGELAFVPYDRLWIGDINIGPRAAWVMGILFLINLFLMFLFFKELKLSTFDKSIAIVLGFSPVIIHYALMTSVSITAVGAFDAVGSILVVAFMVVPAGCAYLLTEDLKWIIILSLIIGTVSSIIGYYLSLGFDSSIAGSITTVLGLIFILSFVFSPKRGLFAVAKRRKKQRYEFASLALLIHLNNHEGTKNEKKESELNHLQRHFKWNPIFSASIVNNMKMDEMVIEEENHLKLTSKGEDFVAQKKKEFFSTV